MKLSELTGKTNYFEDFTVGEVMRHARGKTIEGLENVLITNLVMNTAQGHFNEHAMRLSPYGGRLSYGGVNFSVAMGLAMQDTGENALAELSMDNIRLLNPVVHGDTLYAYSEVLSAEPSPERQDAGVVTFRHWGVNQDDKVVFEGERTMLIKRRSHWGDK
ncbi:MAG TPA: MaoC family dehydratase [Caulobacteraceae bacterium]|nr:MaoC family dehydratase [Caulobacteraceae bacterium]